MPSAATADSSRLPSSLTPPSSTSRSPGAIPAPKVLEAELEGRHAEGRQEGRVDRDPEEVQGDQAQAGDERREERDLLREPDQRVEREGAGLRLLHGRYVKRLSTYRASHGELGGSLREYDQHVQDLVGDLDRLVDRVHGLLGLLSGGVQLLEDLVERARRDGLDLLFLLQRFQGNGLAQDGPILKCPLADRVALGLGALKGRVLQCRVALDQPVDIL